MSAILTLALLAAQRPKTPASTEYLNTRYGYIVDVPSSLRLKQASDNGDGRSYLSKDARTELLVYGSTTLLDEKGEATESLAGAHRRWVALARTKGRAPLLSGVGKDAFQVKWADARRYVHVRTVRGAGTFATIELRYPRDRSAAVETAMRRTVASLRSAPSE